MGAVAPRRFFGGSLFTRGTNMILLRMHRKCDGTGLRVGPRRLGTNTQARKKTVFALTSLTLTTTTGSRNALTFSLSSGVAFLQTDKPNSALCTRTRRHCVKQDANYCRISIAGRGKSLVTAFRSDMFEGRRGMPFRVRGWGVKRPRRPLRTASNSPAFLLVCLAVRIGK